MVWYNPKTWFAKKIKPSETEVGSPLITPAESNAGSTGTVVSGPMTSVVPVGNIQTAISSSGGGGRSSTTTSTPTFPIENNIVPVNETKLSSVILKRKIPSETTSSQDPSLLQVLTFTPFSGYGRELVTKTLTGGYTSTDYKRIQNLRVEISKTSKVVSDKIDRINNRWSSSIVNGIFVGCAGVNPGIDLDSKYSNLIKDNKFVGTKEQYNSYLSDYDINKRIEASIKYNFNQYKKDVLNVETSQNKLNTLKNDFKRSGGSISNEGSMNMPIVNIGGITTRGGKVILKGKNVSLSKFEPLFSKTGLGAIDTLTYSGGVIDSSLGAGGTIVGEIVGKALGKKEHIFRKERNVPEKVLKNVYTPQFGTQQIDSLTGNLKGGYNDLIVPAHTKRKLSATGTEMGEKIGDTLSFTTKMTKWVIPVYGSALYTAEIGKKVYESGGVKPYIHEHPYQAALTLALIGGLAIRGGSKVIKTIKAKKISKQLSELSKRPIKYIELVDKPGKQVSFIGVQETSNLKRVIKVKGALKKTVEGFEFFPSARGFVTTTGKVKKIIGSTNIFKFDEFLTGAKGGSVSYKNIGNIKWLKTFGSSTYEPLASSYALFNKVTKISKIDKVLQKNIILGGTPIKEITLGGNLFKLSDNFYMGSQIGQSLGFIFVKNVKSSVEKMFGIASTTIKKTPFSKTFSGQKLAPPTTLFDVSKIKKGLTSQSGVIITTSKISNIPYGVGGLTIKEKSSFGLGDIKLTSKLGQFPNLGVGLGEVLFFQEKQKQRKIHRTKNVLVETQVDSQDSFLDSLVIQVAPQAIDQKQRQKQRTRLVKPLVTTTPLFNSWFGGGTNLGLQDYTPLNNILFTPLSKKKNFKSKKLKPKTSKTKGSYVGKITGFESALGLAPRYVKVGKKFTGFEVIRGVARKTKKKKKIKKKKILKRKLPKKDELSKWLH